MKNHNVFSKLFLVILLNFTFNNMMGMLEIPEAEWNCLNTKTSYKNITSITKAVLVTAKTSNDDIIDIKTSKEQLIAKVQQNHKIYKHLNGDLYITSSNNELMLFIKGFCSNLISVKSVLFSGDGNYCLLHDTNKNGFTLVNLQDYTTKLLADLIQEHNNINDYEFSFGPLLYANKTLGLWNKKTNKVELLIIKTGLKQSCCFLSNKDTKWKTFCVNPKYENVYHFFNGIDEKDKLMYMAYVGAEGISNYCIDIPYNHIIINKNATALIVQKKTGTVELLALNGSTLLRPNDPYIGLRFNPYDDDQVIEESKFKKNKYKILTKHWARSGNITIEKIYWLDDLISTLLSHKKIIFGGVIFGALLLFISTKYLSH